LIERRIPRNGAVQRRVARIVADVRARGDAALLAYARTLDGLAGPIEVSRAQMTREARRVPADWSASAAMSREDGIRCPLRC
jgi:histidinol dehydrogenase